MNSRERFVAACRRQPVDRPPVWLMRQAGRYLPEYRALREQHSFWELMRTPELAVEVTLQPLRRYGMDAAILFSDILVALEAMGADVSFGDGGPVVRPLVRSSDDLKKLHPVKPDHYDYIASIIRTLCQKLQPNNAVIGFAGAPFTLAAYLVEEGPAKTLGNIQALASEQPTLFADLMSQIAESVATLLEVQIDAGADVVQIFDTWAGKLDADAYRRLALPAVQQVVQRIKRHGKPIILYVRNSETHAAAAAGFGGDVLSVDQTVAMGGLRRQLDSALALQGNFDPEELHRPTEWIRERVQHMIDDAGPIGTIVNLGQGLTPTSPVEGVGALVQAVQDWRA